MWWKQIIIGHHQLNDTKISKTVVSHFKKEYECSIRLNWDYLKCEWSQRLYTEITYSLSGVKDYILRLLKVWVESKLGLTELLPCTGGKVRSLHRMAAVLCTHTSGPLQHCVIMERSVSACKDTPEVHRARGEERWPGGVWKMRIRFHPKTDLCLSCHGGKRYDGWRHEDICLRTTGTAAPRFPLEMCPQVTEMITLNKKCECTHGTSRTRTEWDSFERVPRAYSLFKCQIKMYTVTHTQRTITYSSTHPWKKMVDSKFFFTITFHCKCKCNSETCCVQTWRSQIVPSLLARQML